MPSEPAITLIRPPQLTTKAPYAYAAVTGAGQLVFTAGACPLDADGNTVAIGDVAGQAQQVMVNLAIALQVAGAQLTDVVKTTVYVASSRKADLGTAWHRLARRPRSLRRARRPEHAARRHRAGLRRPAGRGRGDRDLSRWMGWQLTVVGSDRRAGRGRS